MITIATDPLSSPNITIQVKCAHCGQDYMPLEISTNTIAVVLQPCPNCIHEAWLMGRTSMETPLSPIAPQTA